MKKQFEITKQDFEITKTYPAFKIGTDTDSDVLARMGGVEAGEEVAQHKVWFERKGVSYYMEVRYSSQGDQSLTITTSFEEKDSLEGDANDGELTKEEEVIKMAHLIKEGSVDFSNNCWYEGKIKITSGDKTLVEGYESDLGLEGVHDSIGGIKDEGKDINLVIEYLMEEEWLDPSNAEQFIEGLKE